MDRGEHQVLQHLDVGRVDDRRVDLHRLHLEATSDLDLHDATARMALDDLIGRGLLRRHQLLAHLLRLLEQVVHVRLVGHVQSSTTSAPSNASIT